MNSDVKCPNFDGTNYVEFKNKIMKILLLKDIDEIVTVGIPTGLDEKDTA
jgi:hypothetical protein